MDVVTPDQQLARIAALIADPARARMLCCLLDGRARTATELAAIADISASTTSVHLARFTEQGWLRMLPQGRHRYFQLDRPDVAQALESLLRLAAQDLPPFQASTPQRLRLARRCYDHLAGEIAVAVHDACFAQHHLIRKEEGQEDYQLTPGGEQLFARMGIETASLRSKRRRFACACMDWSERRSHLAGALGAALLNHAMQQRWLEADLDSRALQLTSVGKRQFQAFFGIAIGLPPS